MRPANFIQDAGLELFDADAQLVMAQGATPANAVVFKNVALQSLAAARKKIAQAEKSIEQELYAVPNNG